MATPSVEELLKRWQKAETRKEHWRSIYEEAYEYCLPQRNLYNNYDSGTPGQSKMNKIFDKLDAALREPSAIISVSAVS